MMNQIYFEANGEALLKRIGMSKSEFARRMVIRKQNVKALFKTKNLETIYKASEVLVVPFELLVGYIEEQDLCQKELDRQVSSLYYERMCMSKDKNALQRLTAQNAQQISPKEIIHNPVTTDYGETTVQYAIEGLAQNIFVSKYRLQLPSEDELRKYMLENITEEDSKRYQEEEKKSDPQ